MFDEAMDTILTDFADLLETRVGHEVPTTEDSVRYTLFAAMLRNKVGPHEVVQEFCHPLLGGGKRVDTWMPDFRGQAVAMEFKHHPDPRSGTQLDVTNKAGEVFEDLRRLQLLSDDAVCYLVYVAGKKMDGHFGNQHEDLHGLARGESFKIGRSYIDDQQPSFKSKVDGVFEAAVTAVVNQCLLDHNLRVWRVAKA